MSSQDAVYITYDGDKPVYVFNSDGQPLSMPTQTPRDGVPERATEHVAILGVAVPVTALAALLLRDLTARQ